MPHFRGLYLKPMREKPVLTDEDVKQRKAGRPLCIAGEASIQIIWRAVSSDGLIVYISLELEQDGRPQGVCQHVHEKADDVLDLVCAYGDRREALQGPPQRSGQALDAPLP